MICAHCGKETTEADCVHCTKPALLSGRYRLDELVGQGASACTYRATDPDGKTVAIKELPLRRAKNDKALELFHREARVLRQLDHDSIPQWIDDFVAGEGKQQALYIVQEFIEGASIADELDAHRYDEDEVLDIIDELAGVLDYLHSRSPPVIHRDIKPDNVLRRAIDGRLVLVDFGSVRDSLKDPDFGGSTVTGTFGYMAPEQYRGDATPQSDLYGLGALGVTLLSRRPPHTMLDLHRHMHFEDHVQTSPPVTRLLNTLLAVDPRKRLADAEAVHQAVDRARGLVPIGAPPATPTSLPALPDRPSSTKAKPWVAIAVGLGMLALGVGVSLMISKPSPAPAPPTTESVQPANPAPTPPPQPITRISPSVVPVAVQMHHTLNDQADVRECFRNHGSLSKGTIYAAIAAAPPSTLQSIQIEHDGPRTRLERCLQTALQPGSTSISFVSHWEGKVQLVRQRGVNSYLRAKTVPKDQDSVVSAAEVGRLVRDQCVMTHQSGAQPRAIGADIETGDKGTVRNVRIQPKEQQGSDLAKCIRGAMQDKIIQGNAHWATIWWWWDNEPEEVP